MTSDEASEESEFLPAFKNASLQSFVHKTLKDEQIECIHRIACNGRDLLAVLPTGLGKSSSAICVFNTTVFVTCDQASLIFCRGGKVRLIQLLAYLPAAP